ncbi:MAG: type IV toxin-antitoxin system AbiEi family antitoxin domain-containing protein [Thermoleophilia bacterium]|nr:type IV toxin-antitoxin system AbiEi family antitoxin domain-containing protein [Thermoleophilia bacterium]
MRAADVYAELLRLNQPIVTTREAAALWQAEQGTARRRLRTMQEAGLVLRLRQGLWALDPKVEPFVVPPFLTAPFPAYVSFWSALYEHDMIEQIPRQISVASLDRSRRVTTALRVYEIHHLTAKLIGGFEGSPETGYLATPGKALFDTVYIRAAAGSRAYFPELSLPEGFDRAQAEQWTDRIESSRLRTLVARRLREVLR